MSIYDIFIERHSYSSSTSSIKTATRNSSRNSTVDSSNAKSRSHFKYVYSKLVYYILLTSLGVFLRSSLLRDFCRQYNGSTLSQIHQSFANQDRIAAIIAKEKALSFPEGKHVNGVVCKHDRDPEYRVSKLVL